MEGPEGFDYSLVDKNVCGELSSGMELPSTLEILPPAENHACYTARQKSDPAISFEFSRQGSQCLTEVTQSRSLNACQLSLTIQVIYNTTSCCKADMVMQDANASAVTQQEQGSQVKHTVHALAGERIGQLIA